MISPAKLTISISSPSRKHAGRLEISGWRAGRFHGQLAADAIRAASRPGQRIGIFPGLELPAGGNRRGDAPLSAFASLVAAASGEKWELLQAPDEVVLFVVQAYGQTAMPETLAEWDRIEGGVR